jgi:hypothetical protein
LTVHFILTLAVKGHPKPAAQSNRVELGIVAQGAQNADEKLAPRILCRIRAFHQSRARRVNSFLIVAII